MSAKSAPPPNPSPPERESERAVASILKRQRAFPRDTAIEHARLAERLREAEGERDDYRKAAAALSADLSRFGRDLQRAEAQLGVAREGLEHVTGTLVQSWFADISEAEYEAAIQASNDTLARLNAEPPAEQAGVEAKDVSE